MSGRLKNIFAYLLVAISIAACGSGTESKTPPVPTNPTTQNGGNGNDTLPPGGSLDPRIAEFTKTVTLFLTDFTNFTGLNEFFYPEVIMPVVNEDGTKQLVGDGAKIQVKIPKSNTATFNGSRVLIAVEHANDLSWVKMSQFPGTGFRNSTSIDVIFADDLGVLRVTGTIGAGNVVSANVKYRVRASGEEACLPKTRTGCEQFAPGSYWYYFYSCNVPLDTATPCQTYMSDSTAVKSLGTFSAPYSDIAILEGTGQ